MTSRRLQVDVYVKTKKKPSVYGKIVGETAKKKWNVELCSGVTETKSSAQLALVEKEDLPSIAMEYFRLAPVVPVDDIAPAIVPASIPVPTSVSIPAAAPAAGRPKRACTSSSAPASYIDSSNEDDWVGELPPADEDDEDDEESYKFTTPARNRTRRGSNIVEKKSTATDDDDDDDDDNDDDSMPCLQKRDDDVSCASDDSSMLQSIQEDLITEEQMEIEDDIIEEMTKDAEYRRKHEEVTNIKASLIGKTVEVKNGKVTSKWIHIKDVDDQSKVTMPTARDDVGIIGLDFNRLSEAKHPFAHIFNTLWPGDPFKQLQKLNVAFRKRYPGKPSVTMKEFFTFIACLIAAGPAGYGGKKLWKPPVVNGVFSHPDLNDIMKYNRFICIKAVFPAAFACDASTVVKDGEQWSPVEGLTPANDPWAAVQGFVNDFNTNRKENVASSNRKIADESMSPLKPRSSKTGNLPHLSYIRRKPKPLGTELKTLACAVLGIMLYLEIQRGKDGMKDSRYQKKFGATTACTLRMGEAACDEGDTLIGDSWFASVKTTRQVGIVCNGKFLGIVKTAHVSYPHKQIEEIMADWPAGTHVVLQNCFDEKNILAIGYKYTSKKVICFVATVGTDLTIGGDPYMSRYKSELDNYKTREIFRPAICSNYFNASNSIDVHNQLRQGLLLLEEHWKTNDGWFRIIVTIIGMTATDAYLASVFSFPSDSAYSCLHVKDFANALAAQLASYPFPNASSFGSCVVKRGTEAPRWYEKIPGRFQASPLPIDTQPEVNVVENVAVLPMVGNFQLLPGMSVVSPTACVSKPDGAPGISCDITDTHKQARIRIVAVDGKKRQRPPQCKMCRLHGLKQKKPPFLCAECSDFFCHDVEAVPGFEPRGCFWAHMCYKFKDSGATTGIWNSTFDVWNEHRIEANKEADGLAGSSSSSASCD